MVCSLTFFIYFLFYNKSTINLGKVDDSLDEQATMVKDKSAKLEAKLEREIKKKMVKDNNSE